MYALGRREKITQLTSLLKFSVYVFYDICKFLLVVSKAFHSLMLASDSIQKQMHSLKSAVTLLSFHNSTESNKSFVQV